MADRLNMSLDEVISKNSKPSSSHGSRGRGRGRGGGRGAARARRGRQYHPYGGRSNKGYQGERDGDVNSTWTHDKFGEIDSDEQSSASTAPVRSRQGKGRGSGRSRNLDSTWTHDKFDEINSPATRGRGGRVRGGGRSGATGGGVADGGGKIELENLSYEVTEADLKELFEDFGEIKSYRIHFDRTGRSTGKAEVVFRHRSDAKAAANKYNGVVVEGMRLGVSLAPEVIKPAPVTKRLSSTGGGGPSNGTKNSRLYMDAAPSSIAIRVSLKDIKDPDDEVHEKKKGIRYL